MLTAFETLVTCLTNFIAFNFDKFTKHMSKNFYYYPNFTDEDMLYSEKLNNVISQN